MASLVKTLVSKGFSTKVGQHKDSPTPAKQKATTQQKATDDSSDKESDNFQTSAKACGSKPATNNISN